MLFVWQADGVVAESNGIAQMRDVDRPLLHENAKGWPAAQPQRLPVCFCDCNPHVPLLDIFGQKF